MRIAQFLGVAIAFLLPAAASAASPRVALHALMIPAPALHSAKRSVIVYLPPSYDRPEAAMRRYPVILLLHGEPGWNGDWENHAHIGSLLDTLIARHRMPEVIALMPDADGPGPGGRSLYINSFDGRMRMEDFLTRDLLDWADRTLRTRSGPAARALVGVSDGANAAINLAFKHPDLFSACAGHSGEYAWKHVPHMPAVLGEEPGASRLLRENSPVRYVANVAPQLRALAIYFDSGLLDFAFWDDRKLDRELTELGVPHVYHEYWGWHEWGAWRARLSQSLPFVTRRMW